jgi:hypothetical protein
LLPDGKERGGLGRTPPPGHARARRAGAIWIVLVFGTICAVYAACLGNEFVSWDDHTYVTENPYLTDTGAHDLADLVFTPELGYPLPLVLLVYRTIHQLFGMNPAAFHAANVLVHALNGVLLLLLLRKLFALKVAVVGALIWAFHPVVVEPVAWATGLKDLLVTAFTLISITGVIDLVNRARSPMPMLRFVLGAVLALLSKPTAVSLVPMILLASVAFAGIASVKRKEILGPLIIIAIFGGLFVATGLEAQREVQTITEVNSFGEYLATISSSLQLSLLHTLWPSCLLPKYLEERTALAPYDLVSAGVAAAMLVGLVASFKRRHPRLAFFLIWTAVFYAPYSNVVPLSRFTADSYLYLPLIGVVGLVCLTWERLSGDRAGTVRSRLALAVMISLVVCLALLAVRQQSMWRDSEKLWRPVLERYRGDADASEYLAVALRTKGKHDEALALYRAYESNYLARGRIPANYPALLAERGKREQAERVFALALDGGGSRDGTLRRNFIGYLINNPERLNSVTTRLAREVLPAVAREQIETADDVELLARTGDLAGKLGMFEHAEILFAKSVDLGGGDSYRRAGRRACEMVGRPDCSERWSPGVTPFGLLRAQ